MIRTGGVLRRTGLARHTHARDIRRRTCPGGNNPRHVSVDDARTLGGRRRPPYLWAGCLKCDSARRQDGIHEVGLHDAPAVCERIGNECHLQRRDEQLSLPEAELSDLPITQPAQGRNVCRRHGNLRRVQLCPDPEAVKGIAEPLVPHAHGEGRKGDVARFAQGIRQTQTPVYLAVRLMQDIVPADRELTRAVEDLVRRRDARGERRIGDQGLEGRAGRVEPLRGTVDERAVRTRRERIP